MRKPSHFVGLVCSYQGDSGFSQSQVLTVLPATCIFHLAHALQAWLATEMIGWSQAGGTCHVHSRSLRRRPPRIYDPLRALSPG